MQKNIIFCLFLGTILIFMATACRPNKPTVKQLRAERHVQDSLALTQQQRSLAYYDSLLQATLPTVDPILKRFRYVREDQYEDHGHYEHRLLSTTSNTARNFIQIYITDDYRMEVKAYYYGSQPIDIQRITIHADSIYNTLSGTRHGFEAEGYHETFTLNQEDGLSLLKFIDSYANTRLQICYEGARSKYRFYLSDNDKQALLDSYQLGCIISDIHQLEQQIRQTSLQIEKYQKRLQKQQ